jgi:hypothetical protein
VIGIHPSSSLPTEFQDDVSHRTYPSVARARHPGAPHSERNDRRADQTAIRPVSTRPGPVPLAWLQAAACLPGRALQVGLALWYLIGVTKSATVSLSSVRLAGFGVDRSAKRRALTALAGAGLITLDQAPGRNPAVTVITDFPPSVDAPGVANQPS